MKKLLILLGILAGVAVPYSVQASPDDQATKKHGDKADSHVTVKAARPQHRTIYYITSNVSAGSHIPTVVRQSNGHNEALNGGFLPNRFFGGGDLDRSNGTNIGTSLMQLDPSITVH